MTCREARELIQKSLGEGLEDAEHSGLEGHLGACGGCRRYASVFAALRTRLASFAGEGAPGASGPLSRFMGTLEARGASAVAAAAARRPSFAYAATAAMFIAAAVFVAIALVAPASSVAQTTVREHRLRVAGTMTLDSHADCCKDLKEWFEARTNRPIEVPEIKLDGLVVEGGKMYRHSTGNEIFFMACRLEGEPVSLFACCGPSVTMPKGERFGLGPRRAVLTRGSDYTMISWRVGEYVNVLVTCCGPEKSKAIFATIGQ